MFGSTPRYNTVNPTNFPVRSPVKPILRWAGSKRKLLQHLIDSAPPRYSRYIEPFAGSACLFFALAPERAILGDTNEALIETYEVIRSRPLQVLKAAKLMPQGERAYYRIRQIKSASLPKFERAVRFLYLNRFCFNGLYRTNKRGIFNVPYGSRTGGFPTEAAFCNAAFRLRKAELVAEDFETVLKHAKNGDFVYLDPPYASGIRNGRDEYGVGSFGPDDIPRLIASLKRLHEKGVAFLLSYSNTPDFLDKLPRGVNASISVRRHIASCPSRRQIVREFLLTNKALFETR